MRAYILRDIDDRLWSPVKAQAEREGLTVRALILALLRAYADRSVFVTVHAR
jgi:hypothetical protein